MVSNEYGLIGQIPPRRADVVGPLVGMTGLASTGEAEVREWWGRLATLHEELLRPTADHRIRTVRRRRHSKEDCLPRRSKLTPSFRASAVTEGNEYSPGCEAPSRNLLESSVVDGIEPVTTTRRSYRQIWRPSESK
jgi:hypothetical protein